MRKLVSILTGILLVILLAVPAMGDGVPVIFTADSKAEPGCKLTVDEGAMLDHDQNSAESYNALLERTVLFRWFKDGKQVKEGKKELSYKVTEQDVGSEIYVQVLFFGDLNLTVDWGSVKSQVFTVTDPNAVPAPSITTKTLPEATVGKAYQAKLECTDGDALFSEIMGSQLTEFGLTLTQHGEIEGTPTKSGNCHINVKAVGEGGEDGVSYDLTVAEAPTEAPTETPTETTAPVAPAPTAPAEEKPAPVQGAPWWAVMLIAIASAGLGVGVAALLVNKKSR